MKAGPGFAPGGVSFFQLVLLRYLPQSASMYVFASFARAAPAVISPVPPTTILPMSAIWSPAVKRNSLKFRCNGRSTATLRPFGRPTLARHRLFAPTPSAPGQFPCSSSAFPALRLPSRSRGLAAVLHPVLVAFPLLFHLWLLSPGGCVRRWQCVGEIKVRDFSLLCKKKISANLLPMDILKP